MTLLFFLNWGIMAVSLFNTILMFWLGLTILLNTEHYDWGVWLTGGGFLISGLFFVSHTAIFGYGLDTISQELDVWWRLGWVPVILSPFGWYVAMLWYVGFWSRQHLATPLGTVNLRRRQRPWFLMVTGLMIILFGLLIFANPLPSYTQVASLRLSDTPTVGNIPLLIIAYPIFIVLCIVLSLDALRYPAPTQRVMGEMARRRAWPWLIAASLVLLVVSLLVGWIMFWIIWVARQQELGEIYYSVHLLVTWFDLIISTLIAVAVILVGRAVVSYEVFTGRTLPRRGFFRHWRNVVILAAGYGFVGGGSLTFELRPIYSLMLITVSVAPFYAIFSWRSYAERKGYIAQLRPFVASQQLYDHLLRPAASSPTEVDAWTPFYALCTDILGVQSAHLIAVGPLAPLVGPPLSYPKRPVNLPALTDITAEFISPQTMGIPVDPDKYEGAIWAAPLWSERGLIGVFLLGEKIDGGLFTLEEIEIARASGERLIDTQASAEIARRLMALQRQRLTESQVLDRRTRQVLHDDILPELHEAMLTLSSVSANENVNGAASETVTKLAGVHHQIADLLRDMPRTTVPAVTKLGLVGALHHLIEEELPGAFDDVDWQIAPQVNEHLPRIPALVTEVIYYASREAIRNAAHYARDTAAGLPLYLRISVTWLDGLSIEIEDNGAGIDATAQPSIGSGQGLALHTTMMAVVGGTLSIDSVPGEYTLVSLLLPQNAIGV